MGYTHYLRPGYGVQIGFGGSVAGSIVPCVSGPAIRRTRGSRSRGVHHPAPGRACDVTSWRYTHQLMRSIVILTALLTCTIAVRAQNTEPRIWQGVYSAAQAERGKTSFNSSCLRCHGDKLQGNTAPALSGDRFYTSWGNEVVASLFAKIRDTMPPNFGTSIDDQMKLDIVTYILQTNGYPVGPERADAERQRSRPARRSSRRVSRRSCRTSRWCRRSGASRVVRTTRGS